MCGVFRNGFAYRNSVPKKNGVKNNEEKHGTINIMDEDP